MTDIKWTKEEIRDLINEQLDHSEVADLIDELKEDFGINYVEEI